MLQNDECLRQELEGQMHLTRQVAQGQERSLCVQQKGDKKTLCSQNDIFKFKMMLAPIAIRIGLTY